MEAGVIALLSTSPAHLQQANHHTDHGWLPSPPETWNSATSLRQNYPHSETYDTRQPGEMPICISC